MDRTGRRLRAGAAGFPDPPGDADPILYRKMVPSTGEGGRQTGSQLVGRAQRITSDAPWRRVREEKENREDSVLEGAGAPAIPLSPTQRLEITRWYCARSRADNNNTHTHTHTHTHAHTHTHTHTHTHRHKTISTYNSKHGAHHLLLRAVQQPARRAPLTY